MNPSQPNLYLQRINIVIDYIREHLADDLSLETLADLAGFSRFHFHRVFSSIMGETLADFVARLRLERAVALLKADRSMLVTDAALTVGFSALASFSRAFRRRYGINASAWIARRAARAQERSILSGFPHTLKR